MSTPPAPGSAWELAHVLAEPTRRLVFDTVRRTRDPLTRDQVAELAGVKRSLAAFHLERLAESGLLVADFARPEGRSGGPGAGRPSKRYRAAPIDIDLTVPPRQYEFAARLLAEAISVHPTEAVAGALAVARAAGQRIGRVRRPLRRTRGKARSVLVVETLTDLGYEPQDCADTVRLRNCPFHAVADIAPELMCAMNCELVDGVLEGLDQGRFTTTLVPAPPDCCVTVELAGR